MGVLIEGDPRKGGKRYTIAEISRATGIKCSTLHARRNAYKIPTSREYTYDQVKQIIKAPCRHQVIAGNVDRLKKQLKEDGML